MEEWKEYKLGDIAQMKYGKMPKLSANGLFPVWSGYRYAGFSDEMNCPQGTLIVVARGVGGTGDVKIATTDCFLTNLSISVNLNKQICDPLFLYYKFRIKNLKYLDSGSAQSQITVDDLKRLCIQLPPLKKQEELISILKSLDDKIEVNRRINENLELQAQALFKSWFVDFEPFKNGEFVESELGRIPKGLDVQYISEISHILETGRRPKGGVGNLASGIPSVGAEHVKGMGNYDYSKTKFISQDYANTLKTGRVKGYELLIYKDGGKPGYFIPNYSIFGEGYPFEECYLNEHVFKLDFSDRGYNIFCYFFFKTDYVMNYLNAQGGKAAIPGINRQDIENILIFTPKNMQVQKFGELTGPIFKKILINCKESRRLAELRDTLLPKLMSGELIVTNMDLVNEMLEKGIR
jgi:type I restriction enzyme S subunit